jgi:RNase P subunit RPR2
MKYQRFKQIKDERKKIAEERIQILREMAVKKPERAARYRELAMKIAQKQRLDIVF